MRLLSADPARLSEEALPVPEPERHPRRALELGEQLLEPHEGTLTRSEYLERAYPRKAAP